MSHAAKNALVSKTKYITLYLQRSFKQSKFTYSVHQGTVQLKKTN